MAENTKTLIHGDVSAVIANTDAPFIFFDEAPALGNGDGIVRITLTARRSIPIEDGKTRTEPVVVGYLRCSFAAAAHLRSAIDQVLLLNIKTEGQAN
jgi:hypothetical protein